MNNGVSLFGLTNEYIELYNALVNSADEETGEIDTVISQALEAKGKEFVEKAVAVATVYRRLEIDICDLDGEIKRLTAIKNRLTKQSTRLKESLTVACERTGTTNINGIHANISFRKSEETVIDDINFLPKEYLTEKITYSPNKTKIKEAIKNGEEVQGAHIEVKQNIQIK